MYFDRDIHCCTQVFLVEFGEETPNFANELYYESPCAKDFVQFVERLRKRVVDYDEDVNYDSNINKKPLFETLALVTATTLNTQPIAEGYLEQFGFRKFGPFKRTKYTKGEVSLWSMGVQSFLRKLSKLEKELK